MNKPGSSQPDTDDTLRARVQTMVDRTIQRSIRGFETLSLPKIDVGPTPKTVIYQRGTLRLYHYHPRSEEIYRVPVLIVMSTTNRAYLFDLAPGQSMVEYLLDRGFDVFVIDWLAPQLEERGLTLDDYTQDFIPTCIRKIQTISGEPDVSLIGYCMGGVLSLIYAATHADGPLKNLVCLTTPIDYHEMGLTNVWTDRRYFDVDRLVDSLGIIPADVITQGFDMQRPAGKIAGQLKLWEQSWNDEFVKSYRVLDRFANESLPLAGEYFRQITKDLNWDNKLVTGKLVVGGKAAKLEHIKVSILKIIAEHDHLVSVASSQPLLELVSSTDKEEILLKGGHVSLIAGPNAVHRMWPRLEAWLAERSL